MGSRQICVGLTKLPFPLYLLVGASPIAVLGKGARERHQDYTKGGEVVRVHLTKPEAGKTTVTVVPARRAGLAPVQVQGIETKDLTAVLAPILDTVRKHEDPRPVPV